MDDESLQTVYCWVDEIPLSRPKRNISRDFSDGVLMAEIVAHYFPRIVELHNYSQANSVRQKLYNWNTLNTKVFKKIGWQLSQKDVNDVVKCVPGTVEKVLFDCKGHLDRTKASGGPPRDHKEPRRENGRWNREEAPALRREPHQQLNRSPQYDRKGRRPMESNFDRGAPSYERRMPAAEIMNQRSAQRGVDEEILIEKEETIQELRETVEILELKVKKLEQLVRLKDSKIQALQANRS